jgi:hypothetical protein
LPFALTARLSISDGDGGRHYHRDSRTTSPVEVIAPDHAVTNAALISYLVANRRDGDERKDRHRQANGA